MFKKGNFVKHRGQNWVILDINKKPYVVATILNPKTQDIKTTPITQLSNITQTPGYKPATDISPKQKSYIKFIERYAEVNYNCLDYYQVIQFIDIFKDAAQRKKRKEEEYNLLLSEVHNEAMFD